jgi:hypothetical protein
VLKLDDEVLDAVRREAERTGTSEDQVVEAAIRRYVGPGILDRLAARNRLPEDDAMSIRWRRSRNPAGLARISH